MDTDEHGLRQGKMFFSKPGGFSDCRTVLAML
jgi:hypothetical protein